jgi:hypothetical protein
MRAILLCSCLLLLPACTSLYKANEESPGLGAVSLLVDQDSNAREILLAVPSEGALERFEMLDAQGRTISYVSFTETPTGALVFINQKLYGTLSQRDAQAFYSCRGYSTALHRHWARDANEWSASMLQQAKPATQVTLNFSGKSTVQSIREVVKNPMLEPLRKLIKLGSNPWSIFTTLDMLQDNMISKEHYEILSGITPGMNESQLGGIVRPEDISFTGGGIVMAYPSHLIEFFVSEEIIRVIQQPSFYYLSRNNIALFYAPNTRWGLCNPKEWMKAFPVAAIQL